MGGPAPDAASRESLFGRAAFHSTPSAAAPGGGVRAPGAWEGAGCDLASGAWGGRAPPEPGTWQDLPAQLPLDVKRWRTAFIYSYRFFTRSCVTASAPAGPGEENPAAGLSAAAGSGPAGSAALFKSQSPA